MKSLHLEKLSFEDIAPFWRQHLWPGRISPIEPTSAIDFTGDLNMDLMKASPSFWALRLGSEAVAVSSGFITSPTHYRLRGTWVRDDLRRQNLGRQLIDYGIAQATENGASVIWTMPRLSAMGFYEKCGFHLVKELTGYEFGPHFIAQKKI